MHTLTQNDIETLNEIGTQIDQLLSRPQTNLVKRLLEAMNKILTAIYYLQNE